MSNIDTFINTNQTAKYYIPLALSISGIGMDPLKYTIDNLYYYAFIKGIGDLKQMNIRFGECQIIIEKWIKDNYVKVLKKDNNYVDNVDDTDFIDNKVSILERSNSKIDIVILWIVYFKTSIRSLGYYYGNKIHNDNTPWKSIA